MVSAYLQEIESPKFATITDKYFLPTKKVLLGVKTLDVVYFFSHYHASLVTIIQRIEKLFHSETCAATNVYMLGHQLFTLA